MLARHPRAPLFPYTTLFRSLVADVEDGPLRELPVGGPAPSRHLLEVELQPFRVHLDRRRRLPPPAHLLRTRRVQVADAAGGLRLPGVPEAGRAREQVREVPRQQIAPPQMG